jgi:CBS domain-containing protein
MAGEIMTGQVQVCRRSDTLYQVMDVLSERKLKALPVVDDRERPLGIISKTDLVLAYVHGILPDQPAGRIMSAPMAACEPDTLLSDVILQMFFSDIQHLFVTEKSGRKIQGVISLSDAARFRSGTCRACTASRVLDRM